MQYQCAEQQGAKKVQCKTSTAQLDLSGIFYGVWLYVALSLFLLVFI